MSAHLFGYVALAPLIAYGLAAVVHLVARAFGARGSFLAARAALFWSALAAAPVALGVALVGVAAEAAGQGAAGLVGVSAGGAGLLDVALCGEPRRGRRVRATVRVAAVVVAAFAGIGGLLALAAGGAVA